MHHTLGGRAGPGSSGSNVNSIPVALGPPRDAGRPRARAVAPKSRVPSCHTGVRGGSVAPGVLRLSPHEHGGRRDGALSALRRPICPACGRCARGVHPKGVRAAPDAATMADPPSGTLPAANPFRPPAHPAAAPPRPTPTASAPPPAGPVPCPAAAPSPIPTRPLVRRPPTPRPPGPQRPTGIPLWPAQRPSQRRPGPTDGHVPTPPTAGLRSRAVQPPVPQPGIRRVATPSPTSAPLPQRKMTPLPPPPSETKPAKPGAKSTPPPHAKGNLPALRPTVARADTCIHGLERGNCYYCAGPGRFKRRNYRNSV